MGWRAGLDPSRMTVSLSMMRMMPPTIGNSKINKILILLMLFLGNDPKVRTGAKVEPFDKLNQGMAIPHSILRLGIIVVLAIRAKLA